MITFKAAVASCPRKSGNHNSDNFYFNSKFITEDLTASQVMLAHKKNQSGVQMYAVTDGNAAETYQEEISLMLVRGLKKFHARLIENPEADVVHIIDQYNKDAYAAAKKRSLASSNHPSSSLGLMCIVDDDLVFSNTGNVRIYRIRDGVAELFSVDHTQAQRMVELGLMTSEKALTHPQRKKLTQFFGVVPDEISFKPVVFEEKAKTGDLYVICSCGCYENVSMSRMADISDECDTVSDFVKAVFAEAAAAGVREDITVLAVKAEAEDKVIPPVSTGTSAKASAHEAGAVAGGVAAGTAAVAAKATSASAEKKPSKSSGPVSNAERRAMAEDAKVGKKKTSFSASIKSFLGISTSADGEKGEQLWPALLVFLVCLILVIILTVYGIKIYNKNQDPEPTYYNPYGTYNPTDEPAPVPTSPAVPDGTGTEAPGTTDGTQTDAPINTGAPVTSAPGTTAPTVPPTTEPTVPPTTEPTVPPTTEPTVPPTTEPTVPPTTEPTVPPTTEPTVPPTTEPTVPPTTEPPATVEPTPTLGDDTTAMVDGGT